MDGDAVIRGCNSRTSGGGLTAALRNNGDSVRLAGEALIEQNTAANGAGVYLNDALAEGTVLQLENSGYVSPNPAGVPIVVGEATPQYPRISQTDANGFQNPPNDTVLTPTITLLPLADTPGDRFLGWFDAPEGGSQVREIPLGSTEDRTRYARWRSLLPPEPWADWRGECG